VGRLPTVSGGRPAWSKDAGGESHGSREDGTAGLPTKYPGPDYRGFTKWESGLFLRERKMNQKGVTLIELIIVMVIIAIGSMLFVPNIGAWMTTYRLKSATRDVVSAMRVAQMKAVSTNIWYRVSFDTGNNKYCLENSQDVGATWTKEGGDQDLPSGVQLNTTFVGNIVTFYPNSTATNGSITIVNTKGSQKTIQLWGTTGRIKHG
jgi:prepilin-type N-terminal cleavage/methylation domain-containing protein